MLGPREGGGTRQRLQLRLLLRRVRLLSAKEYVAKLLPHMLKPRFPMWLLLHRRSPKGKLGLRPQRHLQ